MGTIPPAYFQPPQICYLQTIFMVHPPCKFPGGYFQNFHPPQLCQFEETLIAPGKVGERNYVSEMLMSMDILCYYLSTLQISYKTEHTLSCYDWRQRFEYSKQKF